MNISDCRPRASSQFEAVTFTDTAKIKIQTVDVKINACGFIKPPFNVYSNLQRKSFFHLPQPMQYTFKFYLDLAVLGNKHILFKGCVPLDDPSSDQ